MFRPLAVVISSLILFACAEEGPAERVGESLDDAADNIGDAARDVRDEAEDFADDVADNIEDAR